MADSSTGARRRAGKRHGDRVFDRELEDLPAALRWREWMMRVEAVIFASAEPVTRETLARVVGKDCAIELLIDDLREDLVGRPYELVSVAGGWQHRTRSVYADTIRASTVETRSLAATLSRQEAAVLMAIATLQPVTRGELSKTFGKEISRDTIASLRSAGLIASGPRSPTTGAPYTYVTTRHFLSAFGMETLQDLPDVEMLEDAGLMGRHGGDVTLPFGGADETGTEDA
ncbi:SMC-Scp complex subunit ScpB [Rhizobium sp. DKSPLA3]|uniref:SMC-Scp complex subunit ScpB n=1 Tax=Rhizobium quercicola TaxID=2901226 RepID=A0A9X1NU96_9HYPH|nr:SMC-Scp complex subunit ScpB [Rhizobium quercicola]MCD7111315.1 SMC-Scp complex subunit ScpB [Rhizobium quercicola]